MSVAVQAGTAAEVPSPTGAGDVAAGSSPTLGATPVGVDVTGDVSDAEPAVVGAAGDEVPQAEIIIPGTASSRTALAQLTVQRAVRRRDTTFFPIPR
jgi:hypothetical protein